MCPRGNAECPIRAVLRKSKVDPLIYIMPHLTSLIRSIACVYIYGKPAAWTGCCLPAACLTQIRKHVEDENGIKESLKGQKKGSGRTDS